MANSGSTLSSSSSNKWHSTATHTSSSIITTHGYRQRPSIPLSEISTNAAAATTKKTVATKCVYVKEGQHRLLVSRISTLAFSDQREQQCCSAAVGYEHDCQRMRERRTEFGRVSLANQIQADVVRSRPRESSVGSNARNGNAGSVAQPFLSSPRKRLDGIAQVRTCRPSDPLSTILLSRRESDIRRHEVPEHRMRSSSSTPRLEGLVRTRRLSDHLSTTIQRQKTRNEQRHHAYAQLKTLAQRRLNVVAELVTLDEQYEATLATLLLPGNH